LAAEGVEDFRDFAISGDGDEHGEGSEDFVAEGFVGEDVAG
jgi:hypothetical protein